MTQQSSVGVRRVCISVCISIAAMCPGAAHAHSLARLWKAERAAQLGTTTIYLLGITHTGSGIELDPYFESTVVPAFMQADVLELEKSTVVAEQVGECPTPLTGDDGRQVLADARDLVRYGSEQRMLRTFAMLPELHGVKEPARAARASADDDAASLSEYGLIATMTLNARFLRSDAAAQAGGPRQSAMPRPIVGILEEMRPGLAERSLDGPTDVVDAYCDSGAERVALLRQFIAENDVRHAHGLASAPVAEADRAMSEALTTMLESGHTQTPAWTNLVCERNEKWLERLARLDDAKIHFIAVGAAHLVTADGTAGPICSGLPDRLKDLGFVVTRVP